MYVTSTVPRKPRQPIPGYDRDDHLRARLPVCLVQVALDRCRVRTQARAGRAMARDQILVLVRDATSIHTLIEYFAFLGYG